jgi:O-antigen ligase
MMRSRSVTAPQGVIYQGTSPIIPVGFGQMTVALFGMAIYLFCAHSFKLPIASAGIGIGLIGVLLAPSGVRLPQPILLMGAWLLWCAVTGMQSQYRTEVLESLTDYLKIFLIFFVAINTAKRPSQIALVVGLWVLMFDLYPARGSYFNYIFNIGTFDRFGWNFSFANYNDLAAYAILALALAAFLASGRYPKYVKLGGLASTGAIAVLILLTQSRGAFLGLVIAFSLLLLRSNKRKLLIRAGVVAAMLFVASAPASTWQRFANMKFLTDRDTIKEADSSAEQRWIVLQIASAVVKDHALTGVGLGAYSEAHGVYAADRGEWAFGAGNRDTHNMYMNLLAETGLPGALLFLCMLGSVIARAAKSERLLRISDPTSAEQLRILRFGLIAYLISATFGTFHRVSFLYLYLAILWQSSEVLLEQSKTLISGAATANAGRSADGRRSRSSLRGAPSATWLSARNDVSAGSRARIKRRSPNV